MKEPKIGKEAKLSRSSRNGAKLEIRQPASSVKAQPLAAKTSGEDMDDRRMLLISKAIADPRRMAMLRTIAQGTTTCSVLAEGISIGAATLSHHMKELEKAGLIEITKQGRFLQVTLQKKVWKHYLGSLKAMAA